MHMLCLRQVAVCSLSSDPRLAGRAQNGAAPAAWLDAVLHCTQILFLQRVRTAGDRQHVAGIIAARFSEASSAAAPGSRRPVFLNQPDRPGRAAVRLLPAQVAVGRAACSRAGQHPVPPSGVCLTWSLPLLSPEPLLAVSLLPVLVPQHLAMLGRAPVHSAGASLPCCQSCTRPGVLTGETGLTLNCESPVASTSMALPQCCIMISSDLRCHAGPPTRLLTSQSPVLESMLHCVSHAWPCILVGGAATGRVTWSQPISFR